jgi:hypothetical protein
MKVVDVESLLLQTKSVQVQQAGSTWTRMDFQLASSFAE